MSPLDRLRARVAEHPSNTWAREAGWEPLIVGTANARILILSQAPGRLAQASGIAFDDPSGRLLRTWMGVTDEEFWNPDLVAVLPMDAYFPGKGTSGDKPPRRDFAPRWHPLFLEQFAAVRLTIVIGGYAQRRYLGSADVTANVRAAESFRPMFPIVHPSPLARGWRSRNPWFIEEKVPHLRRLVGDALGRPQATVKTTSTSTGLSSGSTGTPTAERA
ncbi:uracil-DNA glycosylase family protein [Microbacterium sp. SSW1-59]|uniref:uracil-DNA glycosylase family protein n=1 Tax=Microbacterium xanthum TaxID=3079794 RepID=UPI002AD498C7|nr:uracil-DNA glycosylase family protein [Microbacterium sp. SSW1-59]MDZ8200014.1 uracil-DNA glycosylase family protein [Microbacterium sp. SSW1-59]